MFRKLNKARPTECGELFILEYLCWYGGVGEVVVSEVEGTKTGHVPQLGGDGLHVVPLHRQVLQLGQLGHLGGDRPEHTQGDDEMRHKVFCISDVEPMRTTSTLQNFLKKLCYLYQL